jgi:hypothetical protein
MFAADQPQHPEDFLLRDEAGASSAEAMARTLVDPDIMSIAMEQNTCEQAGERPADNPDAKWFHALFSP